MSMGDSPPTPTALPTVDPMTIMAAQTAASKQAAIDSQAMNMVNQVNPYGSLTYNQSGTGPNGVPTWTANLALSPQQQRLFDTLQGTKETAGTAGQSLLNRAAYGSDTPAHAIGDMSSGLTKQMMDAWSAGTLPFQQTKRDQLDTKLKNQGFNPGTPGYDNAMRSLDTSNDLAAYQSMSSFQPTAFGEATQLYNAPAQLSSILSQFGAPTDPSQNLVQTPTTQEKPADATAAYRTSADISNANYANQMTNYNANLAKNQAMWSGIFGTGAAVAGGLARNPALLGAGGLF